MVSCGAEGICYSCAGTKLYRFYLYFGSYQLGCEEDLVIWAARGLCINCPGSVALRTGHSSDIISYQYNIGSSSLCLQAHFGWQSRVMVGQVTASNWTAVTHLKLSKPQSIRYCLTKFNLLHQVCRAWRITQTCRL